MIVDHGQKSRDIVIIFGRFFLSTPEEAKGYIDYEFSSDYLQIAQASA